MLSLFAKVMFCVQKMLKSVEKKIFKNFSEWRKDWYRSIVLECINVTWLVNWLNFGSFENLAETPSDRQLFVKYVTGCARTGAARLNNWLLLKSYPSTIHFQQLSGNLKISAWSVEIIKIIINRFNSFYNEMLHGTFKTIFQLVSKVCQLFA